MFQFTNASRSRQAALAIGAAILAATAVGSTAEAKPFKKFGFHIHVGGPGYYGGYGYRPHYGWRRCGWLRRRAIVTGSPYWWHRYRMCRRYY